MSEMTHVWYWRKNRPDRKSHPCRVICRGLNGNVLIEFADGEQVVAPRYAVRRITTTKDGFRT